MPPRRAALEAAHLASLALWLGVVIMSGVAAATIFPQLITLKPHMPAFENYSGDHALIAAGKVANSVFTVADILQLACSLAAVATLIAITARYHLDTTRFSLTIRWMSIFTILACLGFSLAILRPRMNRNAEAYWKSAEVGDNPAADSFHEAFRADHPTATLTLSLTAAALFVGIAASGWSWGRVCPPAVGAPEGVPTNA